MRYWKLILIATVLVIALAYAALASAEEGCENSVDIKMEVTASFVTLPDAPPMTAQGAGEVCYAVGDKSADIVGETVPELVYVSDDPPAGLEGLRVVAEVMPGTTPHLSWDEFPRVELSNVDIRARAYGADADADAGKGPLVDVILSNLVFTTERVEAEGEAAEGYIDPEQLRAVLVGKAVLPDHSYPPYSEWLAGQPVLLELSVTMKNPYRR